MDRELKESLIKQCLYYVYEDGWDLKLCCQYLKETEDLIMTPKELKKEMDTILHRKSFYLKNAKGKKIKIDYFESSYKGSIRYLDSNNISSVEMYDNGHIKKIEWKDERSFKLSGTEVCREDKHIYCHHLSDSDDYKHNLCLLDYELNGKYYSGWLDLIVNNNCYYEYYTVNNGDIQNSTYNTFDEYIYVEDDWYNERIKDFPTLKDIKYIKPISTLRLRHLEMDCIIKGVEKHIKYFWNENSELCFLVQDVKNEKRG